MMKKKILILAPIFLWANFMISAQNVTDKSGKKQGNWSKTYPNGKLMYEGAFKDDQPVGIFKHYYESGKLKIQQNYLPESDISEVEVYENDGKTISATGAYKGKKKDGEWKYYSEEKLIQSETFKNGIKDGLTKIYAKTGVVMEEIPYVGDKITGIRRLFLEDGKLYSEVSYKNDVEDGYYKLFEGYNRPVAEGLYVAGKKEGDWNVYDERGNIVETQRYKNGVLLNAKELKKKQESSYDRNIQNEGKYREPYEMFD